jgi:UDP-glucose 4-epimerase
VAVTGVSGCLGRRLLGLLDQDPDIEKVVGIDLKDPPFSLKLEFHRLDVRDALLHKVLEGTEAVVHLAFIQDPIRDQELMRQVNLGGTENLLRAVARVGARKLVVLSSAAVYGAHPDNPVPLSEDSPLRANPDFPYAWQKLEVERMVEEFSRAHPEVVVTVLRPAPLFGPEAENFLSRALIEAPRVLRVRGYAPPMQFLHEEDAARALHLAIARDLPGAYNVAPDGWLGAKEVLDLVGKERVELPEGVAFALAERLFRMGLLESPPGELHFVMHPWVVSNARLKEAGWYPAHSNAEALLAAVEKRRDYISLGRARFRRSQLYLSAAGALVLLAALPVLRRRR